MVIALVATAVVLGIASFQVVQGLFTALIMTILAILSAAIAFAYYEPLARATLYGSMPAYADAITLMGLFALSLLALRLLFDKFLPGNVVLGVWADRIGGGVLGVVTGMVVVGMVLVAMQMLPFGPSALTYRAYDDSLRRVQSASPFDPDDFTISLVKTLSRGSLAGGRSFETCHDDLLLESFCARNTAELNGRVDAPTDALKSVRVYEPAGMPGAVKETDIPPNPLLERQVMDRILIVRAGVDPSAADEDAWFRMPATHFRLVTDKAHSYYPLAYLTYKVVTGDNPPFREVPAQNGWQVSAATMIEGKAQVAKLVLARPGKDPISIDWVYRIPRDEKPSYLIFRRTSVVTDLDKKIVKSPPPEDGALARKPTVSYRR